MTDSIEVLAWSGCPSHSEAEARLITLLGDLGRADVSVDLRWIESDEEAVNLGFVGSPTFRWEGRDLLPPAHSIPFGLTCRVYRRRDGRASPLPDPDDLRDAVIRTLDEESARAR